MSTVLTVLVVGGVILLGMGLLVVRRALAMKQLLADGVDAEALIVARRRHHSSKGGQRLSLTYEYRDPMGQTYRHTSAVGEAEWLEHPEGSHLPIVYSRSKPAVSMPRTLVEQGRAAMRDR